MAVLGPPTSPLCGTRDHGARSCLGLDLLLTLFLSCQRVGLEPPKRPQLLLVWPPKLGPALGFQAAEGCGGGGGGKTMESPEPALLFHPA